MEPQNISYLRIEHYSGHAEVIKAAEILLEQYKQDAGKKRLNDLSSWTSAARKLIASLWIREDDSFRFGTKNEYFTSGKRKQVWLTSKTLKLFKTARKLGWMGETQAAVAPRYSKKSLVGQRWNGANALACLGFTGRYASGWLALRLCCQ